MSEPGHSAAADAGGSESRLTARWATFGYLFTLYFILGGAETMISPLFPLVQQDLDITESNLAAILAAVAGGIAAFNVIGGATSRWLGDRSLVRATAVSLAVGMVLSAVAPSFWVLLVGQTLLGVAFGIYFPPALASVARMYPDAPGRAIAVWGQAYSFGLAAAAASAFAGGAWRWVYVGCAVPAALAIVYVPHWTEVDRDPAPMAWLAQLAQNARKRTYRLAFYASFGGVSMHFVVIGFATAFFVVEQGLDLRLVAATLIGGRALSAPVKIVGGALHDRRGGPWTVRLMMLSTSALGLPMLLLPADAGVWLLVPFVGMAVSALPVANAMLVAALPPQSGWGIGTFRAALLGSAALLSAIVSGLLSLGVPLLTLMLASLGLPALVAAAMHRAVEVPER